MDLDESIELMISIINEYFDKQLFDIYNSTILMRDKYISYNQFKKDCRGLNITTNNRISKMSSNEIQKKNDGILAMFKKGGE